MVWRSLSLGLAVLVAIPLGIHSQISRPTPTRISDVQARSVHRPAESPNGRFIVVGGDSGLYRYDRIKKNWARLSAGALGVTAWSPDGRFLALSRRDATTRVPAIWLVPIDSSTGLASGPERRVTVRTAMRPAWSRDGRQLAFVSMDSGLMHVWIAPFNGGDERLVATITGGSPDAPAWSADGKSIYFSYGGPRMAGRTARVTLSSGRIDSLAPYGFLIGVSKDGKYLAQMVPEGTVIITSATDGHEIQRIVLPRHVQVHGWSMSEPNQLVGVQTLIRSEIHSVSLATGAVRALTKGDSAQDFGPVISRDGKLLAFTTLGKTGFRIVVAQPDGSSPRQLATPTDVIDGSVTWSPTGTHLAYLSVEPLELHVIDVTTGADHKLAAVHDGWLTGNAGKYVWREDGKALRYFRNDIRRSRLSGTVNQVTLDGRDAVLVTLPDTLFVNMQFMADSLIGFATPGAVHTVSLPSGATRTIYSKQGARLGEPVLSADARSVIFPDWLDGDNSALRVLSLANGESRLVANSLGGEASQFHFVPDGRHAIIAVCALCIDVERRSMVLLPLNGDPPRVLSAQDHGLMDWDVLAFSKDGKTVTYDAELAWRSVLVHIPVSAATSGSKPQ